MRLMKCHNFIVRLIAMTLVVALLFMCTSCSGKKESYYKYLSDVSYDSSICAMVYESIEEEEAKGIVYRQVKDLSGLTMQNDIAVCFYFYTTQAPDVYGITAGVEDMAQGLYGQVLFVAINAMKEMDLASAYGVAALPEFILINQGARISTFEGYNYDYWEISDVEAWLSENGYNVDYTLLEG